MKLSFLTQDSWTFVVIISSLFFIVYFLWLPPLARELFCLFVNFIEMECSYSFLFFTSCIFYIFFSLKKCTHSFIIQRHSLSFQFRSLMNAMNVLVHAFWYICTWFPLDYTPRSKHTKSSCLHMFKLTSKCLFSKVFSPFTLWPSVNADSLCSTTLQTLHRLRLLNSCQLVVSHFGWRFSFLWLPLKMSRRNLTLSTPIYPSLPLDQWLSVSSQNSPSRKKKNLT